MQSTLFPHLLAPGRIGTLALRNRIAVTAMGVSLAEEDGSVGERLIAYHEEQAAGGTALIITGVTGVAWPIGCVQWQQSAISEDRFIPGLANLTARVHAHGAKIAAQLHHGGLVAAYSHAVWGHPLWAPALPSPPKGSFIDYFLPEELTGADGMYPPEVKVLDQAGIAQVVAQFRSAARRAVEANFDGIEIHAGHGYLLSSFISPITNTRTDEYGGSRENRLRFLLEVLAAVRAQVGPSFPVWVKLDSREVGTDGISLEDAAAHAQMVEAAGADAITVTTYHEPGEGKLHSQSHTPHIEGFNLRASAAIKRAVSIPVFASGRIEPEVGNHAIAAGDIDFVTMGRKLLADPHLPNKLVAGDPKSVRPCIYCYTCISAIYTGDHVRCAVNADLTHEAEPPPPIESAAKRIVVIGGGPGGMEATRRLSALGHAVTLIERGDRLGGTLRFAGLAYPPNERLLDWLKREVAKSGAEIRLKTKPTTDLLRSIAPDAIVVATGAVRGMPAMPGTELPHVFSGDELRSLMAGEVNASLRQKIGPFAQFVLRVATVARLTANPAIVRLATRIWMPVGERVMIVGGELVGIELAEFLAERGREVTVVDDVPRFGKGLPLVRRMRILSELFEHGVKLMPGLRNIAIGADAVTFIAEDGTTGAVQADTVIIAKGATADLGLADALKEAGWRVYAIGDATGVSYIEGAMRDARQAVLQIVAEPDLASDEERATGIRMAMGG